MKSVGDMSMLCTHSFTLGCLYKFLVSVCLNLSGVLELAFALTVYIGMRVCVSHASFSVFVLGEVVYSL